MKSFFALILSSILFIATAKGQELTLDDKYIKLVEKGDSAVAAESYATALEFYSEAMRLEPSNPSNILLLSNTGMLQFYMGEDSLAIRTLSMAHDIAPSSVTVLMNRARVYNANSQYARALEDYDKVTQLDSTLADPWRQKAMLQLQGGDVRGAETSIEKATAIEPDSTATLLVNAILYSSTSRPAEAIPYFTRLIKKDAEAEYYAARAMCRLMTDDLNGASEDISDGLRLNDNDPELYVARALLNKRRFREKDSRQDAATAMKKAATIERLQSLGLSL